MIFNVLNIIKDIRRKKYNRQYLRMGKSVDQGIIISQQVPREIQPSVFIGDNSVISGSFVFESSHGCIHIGNSTFVGGGIFMCVNNITIGNNVLIAAGSTFQDHNSHSINYQIRRKDLPIYYDNLLKGMSGNHNKDWSVVKSKPIVIEDDVWIGMNCIILKGVTIGRGAIIGAGSVVRHSIPPYSVVYGNPAVVVRSLANPVMAEYNSDKDK